MTWKKNFWDKKPFPSHDMVDLYKKYTKNTLKRSGKAWIGKCPFHDDAKPSFAIYEETNSYYCFGCGVSGNSAWLKKKLGEI